MIQLEIPLESNKPEVLNKKKEVTGKQEKIVYDLVKQLQPVRTEIIKIEAMKQGVSCADRYLRYLSSVEYGLISSYKLPKDKTKTWVVVEK